MRIDVLNGVNLNLLGRRDQAIYGDQSIQDLETQIYAWARELDLQVRCRQTNHEGEYVGFLHQALGTADGLIVNPGAWTHYSWAIHDALEPFEIPFVEVHLSNIHAREEFRRISVIAPVVSAPLLGMVSHLSPGDWRIGLPFYFCAALQLCGTVIAIRHFRRAAVQAALAEVAANKAAFKGAWVLISANPTSGFGRDGRPGTQSLKHLARRGRDG